MMSMDARHKRLLHDELALLALATDVNRSGRTCLEVHPLGSRPFVTYRLEYHCVGYIAEDGQTAGLHTVILTLPPHYPVYLPPEFRITTPLIHPHVYPSGKVCLGEASLTWRPTIQLSHLVLHIGRFIRLEPDYVNLRDAADGRGAAFWRQFMDQHPVPANDDPMVPLDSDQVGVPDPSPPLNDAQRVSADGMGRPASLAKAASPRPSGPPPRHGAIVIRRSS